MKAFLLARVSTDDQKDALPAQTYRLTEYAKRMGFDYELFEILESAYKGNRDEFSNVVDRIKAFNGNVVVVFDKVDRYTRDMGSNPARILNNLRKSGKLEIHFPSDNLYIHQKSPATDLLRLGMGVVVAQYYSDAISDNVKRKFEQKLRNGELLGRAPIGYRNVTLASGKKWAVIDPLEGEVVKRAFKLYAVGVTSVREVAKLIRKEYSVDISKSQVALLLKNPFYHGELKIKGKLYPHKYETLVSLGLFNKVQAAMNGTVIEVKRWGGLPYVYRSLIRCKECGCRITFERKKGKYVYGHCTQAKYKHNASYVNENMISEQVKSVFEAISLPEYAYDEVSSVLKKEHASKLRNQTKAKAVIEAEATKYQHRLERLYEDHLDEKISYHLYESKYGEYNTRLKELRQRLKTFELSIDDDYASIFHLLELSRDTPKLFEKAEIDQKRMMINTVLSNLELDGSQLRWQMKKPFETMAFCNESRNWQG